MQFRLNIVYTCICILTVRQLTVNIGPIKVDDLKSHDLHSILHLTSEFEIKFEKREVDEDKEKPSGRKESLG